MTNLLYLHYFGVTHIKRLIIAVATVCALMNYTNARAQCTNNPPTSSNATFPTSMTGKLVYHTYINYGDGSSQLWVYDFAAHSLKQISNSKWGIKDPMNAVWSPDGNWLLFMGVQNNAWNIFAWPTNNSHIPYNLTHSTGATRNEDPKFSADGSSIVYKQNLANDVSASFSVIVGTPYLGSPTNLTNNTSEDSMPFLTPDKNNLLFAEGTGSNMQVYYETLSTGVTQQFASQGYYPIVRSDSTVFYADTTTGEDQTTYKINPTDPPIQANFNDCLSSNSDAWPVNNSSLVFFAGTEYGNYQLFLGDLSTGARWSLSSFGINGNSARSYLGASYYSAGN